MSLIFQRRVVIFYRSFIVNKKADIGHMVLASIFLKTNQHSMLSLSHSRCHCHTQCCHYPACCNARPRTCVLMPYLSCVNLGVEVNSFNFCLQIYPDTKLYQTPPDRQLTGWLYGARLIFLDQSTLVG